MCHPCAIRAARNARPTQGILLVNAACYYAGAKKGWERRAQPRAVALPEGRVVGRGDPSRAAAEATAAAGGAGSAAAAAPSLWKAPLGKLFW